MNLNLNKKTRAKSKSKSKSAVKSTKPKVPIEEQWRLFNGGNAVTCLNDTPDVDADCTRDEICPGWDENVMCLGAGDGKLERIDQLFNCRPCTKNDSWISFEYNYPGRKAICLCSFNPVTSLRNHSDTIAFLGFIFSFVWLLLFGYRRKWRRKDKQKIIRVNTFNNVSDSSITSSDDDHDVPQPTATRKSRRRRKY